MNLLQQKLAAEIKAAAQKYYTDGSSTLTDAEFDAKVDELKAIAPESDALTTGWGYDVELDSTPGAKVKHTYAHVGSLDKCHNWKELGSDFQWRKLAASLKLDGISIVLYYAQGYLQRAVTRGDGTTGIDVTPKVIQINPALVQIKDTSFTGAVRGEIVMSFDAFDTYATAHSDAKNPRNTVAGLINAKDVSEDLKYLSIVVYTVIGHESKSAKFSTINSVVSWLRLQFDDVAPYATLPEIKSSDLVATMDDLKAKWYGKYPADGIVLNQLGIVHDGNNISYIAKAFKFAAESKIAHVVGVEWALSKTRYYIPRIRITPVELSGATVEYCTGFNAQFIRDNRIGEGAEVEITRSGEVIPHILNVVKPSTAQIPTKCPDCGTMFKWNGVHLECPNSDCGNAKRQDLSVWLEALAPVDGLKDALKFKFLDELYGSDLGIEYLMQNPPAIDVATWTKSGGHKAKMAEMFTKLYGWDGSGIPLDTAIRACNIPRFGDITATKLAECPRIVERFLRDDYIKAACGDGNTGEQLYAAIGVANTEMLYKNTKKLRRLLLISDRISWKAAKSTSSADAPRIAITGKLSVPRAQFVADLQEHGYVVKDDVSRHTFALITDDLTGNSSKNRAATAYGVPKLTETEFRAKYLT